jgi:hypothetical protein
MEDVLDVYKCSYDEMHPLICMDESSKQHIKEARQPIPAKPGSVEKYDTEYERNGVSNMFMFLSRWKENGMSWLQTNEPPWTGRIKYVTWSTSSILVQNVFHW